MGIRLRRRSFLRGVGGFALALPTLDVMLGPHGEAYADDGSGVPCRFLTAFTNISIGGGGDPRHNYYAPNTTGFDYDLTGCIATEPFESVKDEVTLLSGMAIPMKKDNGGVLPRAGIGDLFHGKPVQCQFAGQGLDVPAGTFTGSRETLDVLLAEAIGGSTPFPRLHYAVSGFAGKGSAAVYKSLSSGIVRKEEPTTSIRQAWMELTSAYAPADADAAAQRALAFEQRQSILDIVQEDRTRLLSRLGRADQVRLDQHFENLRALELQIDELSAREASTCALVPDPGPDPEIRSGAASSEGRTFNHSNEDLRARVVLDLVYMAFACDLSRVATIDFINNVLWVEELIGVASHAHDLTHNGPDKTERISMLLAWMHRHQADLIARMRDTPEGAGSMLDHVVFTSWHEGGHGRGPERDGERQSHSVENMCAMIAGRAGGLMPGQHIEATGVHPGRLHVSAMRALGVPGDLGELREDEFIPDLFRS